MFQTSSTFSQENDPVKTQHHKASVLRGGTTPLAVGGDRHSHMQLTESVLHDFILWMLLKKPVFYDRFKTRSQRKGSEH